MPWKTHHGMLTSVAALAIAAGGGGPSPTKTFDFTLGSLPSGVTCTSQGGTYFNSSGVLTSAAVNAARLDYNPATLAARGLLVEPAATNLVLGSADLANATYWSLANATATANSATSPDGTTNMALITESSGSGVHFVYTATPPTVASGTNYASSIFIKAGTRRYIQVGFGLVSDPRCAGVVVDTTTMTISGTGAGASGTYVSSRIEDLGGGLARVSVVGSIGATTGYLSVTGTDSSSFSATPSSSGSQTFYAYGGQVELGDFATSYIPTTTASVTRAADDVSVIGTDFSSWYNATEGTYVVAHGGTPSPTFAAFFSTDTGNPSFPSINGYYRNASLNEARSDAWGATTTSTIDVTQSRPPGAIRKYGVAYKNGVANNHAASADGAAVVQGTYTGNIRTAARLVFDAAFCGTIAKLDFYNTRLSNSDLQALTT